MLKNHLIQCLLCVFIFLVFGLAPMPVINVRAQNGNDDGQPDLDRARPQQMGSKLRLESNISFNEPLHSEPAPAILDRSLPESDSGLVQPTIASLQTEGVNPALQSSEWIDSSVNIAESCYDYIRNGSFETNTDWLTYHSGNVSFSQYPYHGARSLYMNTQNNQNPYVWQTVQLPAQMDSIFIQFKRAAYLDPGESALFSLWDQSFTNRLAYGYIPATSQGWFDIAYWLDQNVLAGKFVYVTFEMFSDNDYYPSDLYLDSVVLGVCDTPPPDSSSSINTIDLNVSLYRTPSLAERASYQGILGYASEAIYELSNGVHQLGTVNFYQNSQYKDTAHVKWIYSEWPKASVNGYKYPAYGYQISFGDYFSANNTYFLSNTQWKNAGYILAHELGHYYYGMYDEYTASASSPCPTTNPLCPRPSDTAVSYSVMNSHEGALAGDYRWLNFSIPYYFNLGYTAQHRIYGASGWTVLARPTSQDPDTTFLKANLARTYYQALAAVAPGPNQMPSLQLPVGGLPGIRSSVKYNWIPAAVNTLEQESNYIAGIFSVLGAELEYPEPALLVATIGSDELIAKAGLETKVTSPDDSVDSISLRDDGIPPDELADDGKYSGIMPYDQGGTYTVTATFNNTSGQARFTTIGYPELWKLGNLVGESFSASATATIVINNFAPDDHSDVFAAATTLYTDNAPISGRMDRSGDLDIFKGTLLGDGVFVLRLSNFAQGMQPKIRFWDSTGKILLGEYMIIPEPGYYYIIYITGEAGASLYAEISHNDEQAAQGMYEISFGRPLYGELNNDIYLPLAVRNP